MTGLVRKATLFTACGLLLAGAAMASVPSPANSTIPCAINVVGNNGAAAGPAAYAFVVNVKDLANQVIQNSSVSVDFGGCYVSGGTVGEPGSSQDQKGAGMLGDCVTHTVRGLTDVNGNVTMIVNGLSKNSAAGVTPNGPCAKVFADGVLLGTIQAAAFDIDGADGITAGDLSAFLIYSLNPACAGPSPNYCAVVDLDYATGNCAAQDISASDLSVFLVTSLTPFVANGAICP